MTTVLVGAGLLGSAVARTLRARARACWWPSVPWGDPDAAVDAVLRTIAEAGPDWRLAWCAGSGVVGSSESDLAAEVDVARRVVAGIEVPPSAVLLASSAGGVYAGSAVPPFTERHEVRPLAPYGRAKLEVEASFADLAARGSRLAVARFANLYGPGQDLTSRRASSRSCAAAASPASPWSSTSTPTRCATTCTPTTPARSRPRCSTGSRGSQPGAIVTKIVASGSPTTISGLVGAATRALRRRPPVVHARAAGGAQVRDLRLRSVVWRDLDRLVSTPLVVGLRHTADEVAAQHRAGLLDVTRK